MNSILEFNGTNGKATILWLDHIEAVARKMGFYPLEIGMSKCKGMALCDVYAISKEGNLWYIWFHQLLIEHYSNIPYLSDTLNTYVHLMQGENEMVTQYLARAKVLLEHIYHTFKLCNIPGSGYDNLYLVQGLHSPHVLRRVACEQDTWRSMEDAFQMIYHVTRSKEQNKVFFKPNFETTQLLIQVNEVNYGKATRHSTLDQPYNSQPCQAWFSNNFRDTKRYPKHSLKKGTGQVHYKHSPRKLTHYYCEGEHLAKDCVKLAKEKSRNKQKDTDMAKHYKNKIQEAVLRGNISINETSFTTVSEMTYSMEQMEQLLGSLQLDDSD